jgi:thiamine pyrophosphokinase
LTETKPNTQSCCIHTAKKNQLKKVNAAYTKGLGWNIKNWSLTYMVSQLLDERSKYTENEVSFQ